jgi:DNA-binding SARP family transcriptional activator
MEERPGPPDHADVPAWDPPTPRFRLLGRLSVTDAAGGDPVELGSPKQRAVLAVLLLERGRVVSTDRLVDAVWRDDPPAAATASLQAYVSNLRRALRGPGGGPSPIVRRPPGYAIEVPAADLDVVRVAEAVDAARAAVAAERWAVALGAAEAALTLDRGPLLADHADEPWVRADAARLAEVLQEARRLRATALLAAGRTHDAVAQTQELQVGDTADDRSLWLHLVAPHRAGRSPEALAMYRSHVRRLDDELGLEPGPELRALELAILQHDPALAAWPRSPGWTGAETPATPAAGTPPAPPPATDPADAPDRPVGRERELEELADRRAGAARGRVAWTTLEGPAGIGKTRLAEEHVRGAREAGWTVAWARCSDDPGAPAWWPVRQLVRALGGDADALLAPATDVDADTARFAVYDRVGALLTDAAGRSPVAVVVDDVQWADPVSARCLAHLASTLRDVPVDVVLTHRVDEDDAAVRPLLHALAREGGHRRLPVGPLTPEAIGALASDVSSTPLSPDEVDGLVHRTGGNPLFVREYARLGAEERRAGGVPHAVRSVLGRRLDGLEPATLGVLQVAAVLDDVQDLALIGAVACLGVDAVADVLDDAADERIVVSAPGTGGYAFAHGLLRDEVVEGLAAGRRRRLHLRAAAALDERAAAPARVAQHLVRALPLADPVEVLAACRRAAGQATAENAAEEAARWWSEALRVHELVPAAARPAGLRDDLLVARVEALARAGRGQSLLDVVEDGLLEAVREDRPSAAGRLAASLLRVCGAWPWVSSGDPGPLRERLESVEALLGDHPAALARVLAASAVGNAYHPDPTVADDQTSRALAIAEELDDPEVLADALLGRIITYSGIPHHAEETLALIARLEDLPHDHGRVDAAVGHSVASMATMVRGDVAATAEHVRQAIAAAELLRLPVVRVQLRWMQALLAQWRGDLDEAQRQIAIAARVHRQTELHSVASIDLVARQLDLEHGRSPAPPLPDGYEPVAWAALDAGARGDADAAEDGVRRWFADAGRPFVWTTLSHAVLLGDLVADLGLRRVAGDALAFLRPHAHRIAIFGQVGIAGVVGLTLARLHHLLGDDAAAAAHLDDAARLAEREGGALVALRCRAFAEELHPERPDRDDRLRRLAEDAAALGVRRHAAPGPGTAS